MDNHFLVIGLPNSGKSSIINCLTNRCPIISDQEGTTVDFISYPLQKYPNLFLVDTAGYTKNFVKTYQDKIKNYKNFIFVIDGSQSISENQRIFLNDLRKIFPEQLEKALLIINKIDKLNKASVDYDILNLFPFNEILEVSAINKVGLIDLLDYFKSRNQKKEDNDEDEKIIEHPKVAILGKTNVGKSSLMNLLAQKHISVVKNSINTTVDPVSYEVNFKNLTFILQDTAGFSTDQKIRYDGMVYKNTMEVLKEAHVVVIMTDHERGITNTDMHLMGLCQRLHKGFIIVINKWDENQCHEGPYLQGKFFNHDRLQLLKVSCINGFGISELKYNIHKMISFYNYKIDTRTLNHWVHEHLNFQNLSMKIKYITQVKTFPPTFAVNMNFKNRTFLGLLQKNIKKTFYNGMNVPIVIRLIK